MFQTNSGIFKAEYIVYLCMYIKEGNADPALKLDFYIFS